MDVISNNIYFEEKKPYFIYIHTCPNLWTYVGMSQNPEQRWNKGEGYKSNIEFYKAIQKFEWNNIRHEIVAETNYRWIAQKIERTLITHFKKDKKSYNETNIENNLLNKKSIRKQPLRKVVQYDKNGNMIKIYDSASDASKELLISTESIRNCCRGKRSTYNGFIWKYI